MSFGQKFNLARTIRQKYPTYIPVLLDIKGREAKRTKYLVPENTPLSRMIDSIRLENQLSAKESIFLLCKGALLPLNALLVEVYTRHANSDGFLYITVAFENTFGFRAN